MKIEKIEKSTIYHVYNRGINGCDIFATEENKRYFLQLFAKYVSSHVSVFSYCLMRNHFHFLVEITSEEKPTIQGFSNFFNAYAKAFNKQQSRTGSLFEKHFKRIKVIDEDYLKRLFGYIHNNPESEQTSYAFSSYHHYINETNPDEFKIDKTLALTLFNNIKNMVHVTSYRNEIKDEPSGLDLQGGFAEYAKQHLAGRDTKFNCKNNFTTFIRELQNTITSRLEDLDGTAKFQEDLWKRPEGGGGRTRVIEHGEVFEKGGVNISEVHGTLPESMQRYFGVNDANFFACGLSLVLHPVNPMVPTVHANWRYFELYDNQGAIVDQWFGGGQDLTPYYLYEADARHFHSVCKTACDAHHPAFYAKFKERCDSYFYNAHRNEARGIGGLFFDYCKETPEMSMEQWYAFVTEVGDSFLDAYVPIVEKRKGNSYTSAQRDWQEIRRGRYVEFNLVHDKGTLFGLKTNGRIESILMSLPPKVQWVYDHHPSEGSEEEKLIDVLKNPRNWIE